MIQGTDGVTQTVNHPLQGGKDFVSEATLPNFLPNLFYRIHFRCVRRNVKQNNIVRQLQNGGSVPCRTITAKQNNIISVFFRQLLQKDIHADSIAIGQDEKVPIACQRLHCAVSIAVLTDMMAGHAGTDTVPAPTVFRLVDPTKSSFILKHKPNVFDSIPASEKAGTLYLRIYPYVDPDKITTMFLFATSPLLSQSGNTKSSIKGNTLNSDSLNRKSPCSSSLYKRRHCLPSVTAQTWLLLFNKCLWLHKQKIKSHHSSARSAINLTSLTARAS